MMVNTASFINVSKTVLKRFLKNVVKTYKRFKNQSQIKRLENILKM